MVEENKIGFRNHLTRVFAGLVAVSIIWLFHFLMIPVLPDVPVGDYTLQYVAELSTQVVALVLLAWLFWQFRHLIDGTSVLVTKAGVSEHMVPKYADIVSKTFYILEVVVAWGILVIFVNNILRLFIIPSNIVAIANNLMLLSAVGVIIFLVYKIAVAFTTEVKTVPESFARETSLTQRLTAERLEVERSLRSVETRIELLDADRRIGLVLDADYRSRKQTLSEARNRERDRMEIIDRRLMGLQRSRETI